MALLNSEAYGDLAKVSATAAKRTPGKFYKVFITGKKRPGQQVGTMQVMYEVKDNAPDTDYLVHNSESINFIPYFIKRFWEKNVVVKTQGEDRPKLVAFGWNDDVPKLDDTCKYVYVIGGLLLDSKTKKAVLHQRDVEDAGIKKNDPVLIFFRCDGTKFNGGMNLVSALADKTKSLPPLSNSPEFERNVVTPRRFICSVKVGTVKSDYGDKEVYAFTPETQLPDKAVEQVMNSAMSLMADFEKQFDRTSQVRSVGDAKHSSTESSNESGNPTFAGPSEPVPETKPEENSGDNFDLGI